MNAATLCTTTACLVFAATISSPVRADHSLLRELDERTSSALHLARDARWEVDEHFRNTPETAALRDDVRTLVKALRNVEDAIFFERSPRSILSLVGEVHDAVVHFEEHLDRCTGAHLHGHHRPAGQTHVRALMAILQSIHNEVDTMTAMLEGALGHPHHGGVVPGGPYRILPKVPSPGPVLPGVRVPARGASSEVLSAPVRSRSGDVLLRLLVD